MPGRNRPNIVNTRFGLRNPEVQVGDQRPVPWRRDADHGPAQVFETHCLTKDIGPAAEQPLPESMADDDTNVAIVGVEPAPHDRADTKYVGQTGRRPSS